MYLVGYDREWINTAKTGWGCGYVMIPKDSRVANLISQYDQDMSDKCGEECTYNKDIGDYIVLGFDTAHSYNNIEEHDFNYVLEKTIEIKKMYIQMEEDFIKTMEDKQFTLLDEFGEMTPINFTIADMKGYGGGLMFSEIEEVIDKMSLLSYGESTSLSDGYIITRIRNKVIRSNKDLEG